MGFIKKLLGGLFSLLGGIFQVFGLGKKSEYILEAEAISDSEDKAPVKPEVAPAKIEAAASAIAAPASQNGKVSKQAATKVVAEPAPTPAATAPKPEPKPETVGNFSTNYLLTNSSGRRRPGPSLNPFMDMAKQVKPQG